MSQRIHTLTNNWDVNLLVWVRGTQPVISTDTLTVSMANVATAVKQDTGNTSLATIVTRTPIPYATRSDTFTGTGNGVTIDASTAPLTSFGVQVKGTGAVPTLWTVALEGSLNNNDFSTILSHTASIGDGLVLWTGAIKSPSLYVRSRVIALTLGSATNIIVTIVGVR